jgi:hypothetical protein
VLCVSGHDHVPFFGKPTITTKTNLKGSIASIVEVESATRVTEQKLKIAYIIVGQPEAMSRFAYQPQNGELWSDVLERNGAKIKINSRQRDDSRKIQIKDGFIYGPPSSFKMDEVPTEYQNTGQPAPLREKCLD